MIRKYFGTDGIRGRVNGETMTAELALKLGMAAGRYFRRGAHRHRVVIGKDTRLSGYMIEPALVAGFTAMGMDVFLFGPIPTPGVSFLTRSLRADIGVMISASHNSFEDNGIKLFGPDGYKLSDEIEHQIEQMMEEPSPPHLVQAQELGRAKRIDDSQARYIEFAKRTFPRALNLEGVKLVIDCANGAAYKVAPTALWELGAEVISIGTAPDGFNINKDCGSTAPAHLADAVRSNRADIGIALDGDADRLIICDESGALIDGDQIIALIASEWHAQERLSKAGIVSTMMSNMGLEDFLQQKKLTLHRTAVGDRYVSEAMRAHGYNLGGEQSGHIILSDFSTTGDGLVAALQVLAVLRQQEKPMSALGKQFEPVPQIREDIRINAPATPLANKEVQRVIAAGEERLGAQGRLVIRPSGTEPLIRVMGEGYDESAVRAVVRQIADAITGAGA